MSLIEIPVRNQFDDQVMLIGLDGVRYKLRFYYSYREDRWRMNVLTDGGDPLILGVKIVPTIDLLQDYSYPDLPPGIFYAEDTSEEGIPPGRDDFGKDRRVKMMYQTAA